MAFVVQATVANFFNSSTGDSFAYSMNADSDRFLMVRTAFNDGDNEMTSVTYNGVAMTLIQRTQNATSSTAEIWGLINPPSGSNTLAFTALNSDNFTVAATGMTGANQTTGWKNATGATGNDTAPTVSVASTPEHFVFDCVAAQEGAGAGVNFTPGAGQTEEFEVSTNGAPFNDDVVSAGSREAGAASVTMSWTMNLTRQWAIAAVDILPIIELEVDMVAVVTQLIRGNFIAAGQVAMVGNVQMVVVGARNRGGAVNMKAVATMTCIPVFVQADADMPIQVPVVFFFIKNKPEFEILVRFQNTGKDARMQLNSTQVFIRISGFPDKQMTIDDAGDGVASYITSPGEFPVGVLTGVFHFVTFPDTATDGSSASALTVEFDSQPFQLQIDAA